MSGVDELSLQHLSDKKDIQKSIFREKPPIELVNNILKNMGFDVASVIPSPNNRNPHNAQYLDVKRDQMGHQL
jgi:hypothetical protein